MSSNMILQIRTINNVLNLDVRPFNAVLLLTTTADINGIDTETPLLVKNTQAALDAGIINDSMEHFHIREFFNNSGVQMSIYGVQSATYEDLLLHIHEKFKRQYFYIVLGSAQTTELSTIKSFAQNNMNQYVFFFQHEKTAAIADIIKNEKENGFDGMFYSAANVDESALGGILGIAHEYFPAMIPFSSVNLDNVEGSTYTDDEKIQLADVNNINIHTKEELVTVYYGKTHNGNWLDHYNAKIALDEYLRVFLTKFLLTETKAGRAFRPEKSEGRIYSKARDILEEFVKRDIILDETFLDENGEVALALTVEVTKKRKAKIKYKVVLNGFIIRSEIELEVSNKNNN